MESGVEQSLEGHQGGIFCLAQGGAYLFSGGEDMCIYTWQYAETGFAPLIKLEGPQSAVQRMTTVEGSEGAAGVLVSAHRGGTIHMWDLTSGAPTSVINTGHTNALCAIWLEESYLFTGALDGHVKVWDGAGGQLWDQEITNQQNMPSGVAAMLVVPEGESSVLVTACDDKALKLWVLPTFNKRGIIGARVRHSDVVRCMWSAIRSSQAAWTATSWCGSLWPSLGHDSTAWRNVRYDPTTPVSAARAGVCAASGRRAPAHVRRRGGWEQEEQLGAGGAAGSSRRSRRSRRRGDGEIFGARWMDDSGSARRLSRSDRE